MFLRCEYCYDEIPPNEYMELSTNMVYETDRGFIVHRYCVPMYRNVVVQETEHLCLVQEIEEDENLSNL